MSQVQLTNLEGDVVGQVRDVQQWSVCRGTYRPCLSSRPALPAGTYECGIDMNGVYLSLVTAPGDAVIPLPGCQSERVLAGIRRFWGSAELYARHRLVYKRGILLYGPPGSGKSVTIRRLAEELEAAGGVVILATAPGVIIQALVAIRQIEPERPLIVVYEDLDGLIRHWEEPILSVLDGQHQVGNVVSIATTNYMDKLPARLTQRPSRFDEVIEILMPGVEARRAYLKYAAPELDTETLRQWVEDTEGFSVAHLRELIAAVWCLSQDYDEVIARLRLMLPAEDEADDKSTRTKKNYRALQVAKEAAQRQLHENLAGAVPVER